MDHILGVSVTSRSVFAALVENRSDGPVILRTMSRPRSPMDMMSMDDEQRNSIEMSPESLTDPSVMFTVGGQGKDSDLFLASEFGVGSKKKGGDSLGAEAKVQNIRTQSVEIELKEILAECADAGYPEISVVISMGLSDLVIHEMTMQESDKKQEAASAPKAGGKASKKKGDRPATAKFGQKRRGGSDREKWVRLLAKQIESRFDPEQVAILPMTPDESGLRRALAVYPRPGEPVVPTLERFVDRGRRMPRFAMIETEISLLLGLTRMMVPADEVEPRRRLTLRVGAEDTAILFLEGTGIRHFETLRSITKYDPAETIGSRVLLLQDEYGLGEVDEILVMCDGDEVDLIDLLGEFFPDTAVLSLRSALPSYMDEFERDDSREAMMATAVAIRALRDPHGRGVFEPVDLLPGRLVRRRRIDVPLAWQNYAVLAFLFASTLFFVSRFLGQNEVITRTEQRIEKQYKRDVVERNKNLLEQRRDSLQYVMMGYDQALQVLDSLLYGSDRWSRAMEMTASNAAAVSGVWIESWAEIDGQIVLTGTATDRNQIVRLAARMDGTISAMTFSWIRDWPVFSYKLTVPLETDLPAAVKYLREQVQLGVNVPVVSVDGSGSAAEPASESGLPTKLPNSTS